MSIRVLYYMAAIFAVQVFASQVPDFTHGSFPTVSKALPDRITRNPAIIQESVVYANDWKEMIRASDLAANQIGFSAAFVAWTDAFSRRLERVMPTEVAR